ncbi:ferric enterobactin transport system permease FepG [Klebsiella pneumoniae]|nr:ferric enterobactin transport system permease FepG [Klebsiella pneumoniae]
MSAVPSRLRGEQLTLAYGNKTIAESLNVTIPDGHFTAIIGPNGCGKSTLLRTLSRLMTPASGHVWLDGAQIQQYASKEVARRIGLLAQNATTPSRRLIASCLLLMAASLLISLLGLAQGPVPLTIDQVFSALFGDAPRNVAMVVNEWRLPRVLMALLIGAALGVSGAIFQSLTRNPLGSPDVMGFNTGAWSGVLVAMVLFGQNLTAIALAAMAGGVLTSLVVWLLAWRNGIETFRLIIIGIGVRAMLVAFNTWLLLRASLETALSAGLWNAGSLNGLTWGKTWPSAPLILLMLVSSALLVRRMRLLEMGDDTACALGVQVERSRLLLMLVAVVLTAASTALAGPISFIALVAPHIARRLSGTARWGLTQSALCGALLLALADYGAQRLFMPWQLPVGVLTVSLGGIYLIALLIQESRKK